MATDNPSDDRFEEIDWEAVGERRQSMPKRTLAFVAALAVYGVLVAASYVDPVGDVVSIPGLAAVSAADWLFVLTLLVLVFYAVVPLATNRRLTRYYWREFKKNTAAVVSLAFLLCVLAVGIVGPMVLGYPAVDVLASYQPPVGLSVSQDVPVGCVGSVVDGQCQGTWAHPLGTTGEGKDIFKMIVFGMRVSMEVGLVGMLIQVVLGTVVGTTAAYFGGIVDELLMRYVDVQISFPQFILFLLLLYILGGSLILLIGIFGFFGWGGIARLVRSEALQRREEEYFRAAEGAGADTGYIIRRHLVPNVSNTVITAATLGIPVLILAEASFSFLGLTDPTVPSWGQVIAAGRGDLASAWWISTIPGFFLFATIMAFNFLGDALRDALDPRQERTE